jgi:aminoglycoside phosphotransferase (APT) family kinase protein
VTRVDQVAGPDTELGPELGPVRPGEELDEERLGAYLHAALDIDGPLLLQQFQRGSANLTYLVELGGQRFVLRRPPFGQIAPGAHDMRREFRVLSRLWQVFDRAPRAYVFCEDHAVIGSDFVVMEHRAGEVIWATVPASMAAVPDAPRRVGEAVVDALADLHAVDPVACGLSDLGRPDGYLARQIGGWRTRWGIVATAPHDATMTAVGEALERRLPSSSRVALIHNDYKIDNCQFAVGRPERVASIFDWDMATLGDPLADLGSLLNYWPDPSDTTDDHAFAVPGLETMGLPTRAAVAARYAERTGADPAAVPWYEAFACWKTAVILQQLHQRYVRGETTDARMATRGAHVGMLASRAARILGELS